MDKFPLIFTPDLFGVDDSTQNGIDRKRNNRLLQIIWFIILIAHTYFAPKGINSIGVIALV